jgi:hypothetical protein
MNIQLDMKVIDKQLRDIALAIRKEIRKKTANSVDMDGQQFEPYSAQYAIAKASYQSMAKPNTMPTGKAIAKASKVNLMLTGKMLRSMAIMKGKNSYEVYFSDRQRALLAYRHQYGLGVPERRFFGISKAEETALYHKYFNAPVVKVGK